MKWWAVAFGPSTVLSLRRSDAEKALDREEGGVSELATGNASLVVLPCYNESENIVRLVEQIVGLDAGLDILVVDDNSPDGTGQLAESLRARYPEISVLHRAGKLGLGTAYLAGFRYGLDHRYSFVITMDADFSHQPSYLPQLRRRGDDSALVVGSRYVEGGGATGWPLQRKIISGFANLLARTVLGVSARDCTSGFRCYRRETLETIQPESILSDGYSFLVEILYRVEKAGLTVAEIPIIFVERQAGKSKINRIEVYKTLATLGRLRFPSLPWRDISAVAGRVGERSALAAVLTGALTASLLFLRRRR